MMIIKLPKDPADYTFDFPFGPASSRIPPEPEREDGVSEAEERRDEAYVHRLMHAIQAKRRAAPPDHELDEEKWAHFQARDQSRIDSCIEANGTKEFERRAWLILEVLRSRSWLLANVSQGLIRNVHTQEAPADMMKQYLNDMMLSMYLIVGFEERMDRIAHPSIAWDFLRHPERPEDQEANRHIALMLHSWGPKVTERWTDFRDRSTRPFGHGSPPQKPEAIEAQQPGTKVDRTAQRGFGEVKIEDDLVDLESTSSETRPPFKAATLRQTPKADPEGPAGDIDMARVASHKRQAQAAASSTAKAKFSEPQSRGFPTATPTKRKRPKGATASDAEKGNTSRQSDVSRLTDASRHSDATPSRLIKQASIPRRASERNPVLAATLEQMIRDNIGNFAGHKKSHRRETSFFGPGG
ncbi:hypothetical protein AC579_2027 [Pseudocercospora musae]|uniref:Uncharacterized protein n=1 Tax=Pseudocercospora musae TaxID=113226 RepID=A0A139IQS5_9PEZI|nr:hypothetical protein AC579_2027 [Pseudocercospora musae]